MYPFLILDEIIKNEFLKKKPLEKIKLSFGFNIDNKKKFSVMKLCCEENLKNIKKNTKIKDEEYKNSNTYLDKFIKIEIHTY